jgi:hypothetical protein
MFQSFLDAYFALESLNMWATKFFFLSKWNTIRLYLLSLEVPFKGNQSSNCLFCWSDERIEKRKKNLIFNSLTIEWINPRLEREQKPYRCEGKVQSRIMYRMTNNQRFRYRAENENPESHAEIIWITLNLVFEIVYAHLKPFCQWIFLGKNGKNILAALTSVCRAFGWFSER